MAKELKVAVCRRLWERYRTSEIEEGCYRAMPVDKQDSPSRKSSFLGYADFTLRCDAGLVLKLRSLEVKVLKGKIYLDFPSEESKTQKDEHGKLKWFPRLLTKTAESRDVFTKLVFRHPAIKAQAEAAIARWDAFQLEQAGGETDDEAPTGTDVPEGADEPISDDNPF